MSRYWRLINEGPGDPAWNMAVDEALAREQGKGCPPTLRIYTWTPPAISFGYFQKTDGVRFDELRRLGIVPVRRITGGRAVLHLGDFSYSITAPCNAQIPVGVRESYRYLCRGFLAAFGMLGIHANMGYEKSGRSAPDTCFALSTDTDIVFKGRKFAGSFQKRIGSSLLQHGSILLRPQTKILFHIYESGETRSQELLSTQITCLEDILGRPIDPEEVSIALIEGFTRALKAELLPDCLTCNEEKLAHELMIKYRWVSHEEETSKN
jgi:lipoyl(octanoyl) transferase